jgi:putative transposase
MGLARSTFYDTPSVPLGLDELVARIGAICDEFECYGYRRVGAALRHQGVAVNGKKLRRLMREHGLQPKRRRRYVVTTDSNHAGPIYPDLAKHLVPERPNQLWVADLTYVAIPGGSFTWRQSSMPGRARWSATPSADRWTPALPSPR